MELVGKFAELKYLPPIVYVAWMRQARNPRNLPRDPVWIYSANGAPGTFEAVYASEIEN